MKYSYCLHLLSLFLAVFGYVLSLDAMASDERRVIPVFKPKPSPIISMTPQCGKTPVVVKRVEYPPHAFPLQGWVWLTYDIREDGSVENINIRDASPVRMFDRSAVRALLGFKYKSGEVSSGCEIVLQFNVEA